MLPSTSSTRLEWPHSLLDGGEMGALIHSIDWTTTPVGPIETWPQRLRTVLSVALASEHPMFVWWGHELVQFYNDGYRPILGSVKHPAAMGQRGRECWKEIWHVIEPMIGKVFAGGSTFIKDGLLVLERHGFPEECYFNYAYSPIRDETGVVAGVFVACSESTRQVIGERRLELLSALGAKAAEAQSSEDACLGACAVLAEASADLPFCLIYALDEATSSLRLAGRSGIDAAHPGAPAEVPLNHPDQVWPFACAVKGETEVGLVGTAWPDASTRALVLPLLHGQAAVPVGFLVAGVSPRLPLDSSYRGFLRLVAGAVVGALSNARAHEDERRRTEALRWLPDTSFEASAQPPVPVELAPTSTGYVLVADDNRDMREYLRRILSDRWTVHTVADGARALDAVRARRPDLVIADVMMPTLDGFGLLNALRSNQETTSIPVILLSARAGDDARVQGLQAGADDYVTKPFSARELVARVGGTLALARARSEAAQTLRESESRFRDMADNSPVMIWITEPDGTCSFLSKSWYDFTGQTPENGLGAGFSDAIHPDDREPVQRGSLDAANRHAPCRAEYRLRRKDGQYRWVLAAFAPRFGAGDEFLGFTVSIIDITERRQVEEAREQVLEAERAARHEAERVNRLKDEFLSTLSHELRTPLNIIVGWADLLGEDSLTREDFVNGIEAIGRSARAQTQRVEDLLDMSRIIAGKLRLDVQRVVLADVLDQVLRSIQPAVKARGLRLERTVDPSAGAVVGDPDRLRQIIWNLLDNAVKFTRAGGTVRASVQRGSSHAELVVSDTGEGIDPRFLPYVFERFRQADGGTSRRLGGLGLGLSIVKELVTLHGGSVQAASRGKGVGASFTVRLPLAGRESEPLPVEPRRGPRGSPDQVESTASPDLTGHTILVVDDDPDTREVVRRVLANCHAGVVMAASTPEALRLLRRHHPTLIVSDIGMAGEDGYDLIRQIRALPPSKGGSIPAIALTAYARPEDRQRALAAGYQAHMTKPIDRRELLTACARLSG